MRPRATHIHTYHAFVKNVTIAIDEATLREARRIAADRSTSLNAMIRECLDQLVARESRVAQARERILNLCRNPRPSAEASAGLGTSSMNVECHHGLMGDDQYASA